MYKLKKLIVFMGAGLLAMVCTGWSAYWFVVRSMVEDRVLEWVELQGQNGISVSFKSIRFDGFPTQLAMHLDEPSYANPNGNIRISGNQVTAILKPWDFSALTVQPRGVYNIQTNDRHHSIEVGEQTLVTLRQESEMEFSLSIDSNNFKWIVPSYGPIEFSGIAIDAKTSDVGNTIRIKTEVNRIDLPREFAILPCIGKTSVNNLLELELENFTPKLTNSGEISFALSRGTSFNLSKLEYAHGAMQVQAKSEMSIASNGYLNGTIDLRLEEGDELLRVLSGDCMRGVPQSSQTRFALAALSSGSANGKYMTLSIQNGVVKFFGFEIFSIPPVTDSVGLL